MKSHGLPLKLASVGGRLFLALGASVALAGCGGPEANGPTRTDEPAAVPAAAGALGYDLIPRMGGNTVVLVWRPVMGASGYDLEIGSSPGAADIAQIATSEPFFGWQDAPPKRTFFVRVRARNSAGAGPPSVELKVVTVDLREVIEALFLGSGPLLRSDVGCVRQGYWLGFPAGTTIRIRVSSTTVRPDAQEALRRAGDQVAVATLGQVSAIYELTAEDDPRPIENEVTVATHPDPRSQGCQYDRGCTIMRVLGPHVISARALLGGPPYNTTHTDSWPHDAVGHGILAMCHLDEDKIGGGRSIMSAANTQSACGQGFSCSEYPLTSLDLQAARAVYGSGLSRGSSWLSFANAGLVNSSSAQAAVRGGSVRSVRLNDHEELLILDY